MGFAWAPRRPTLRATRARSTSRPGGLQKITAEVREREVDGRIFSKAEAEAEPFEVLSAGEGETGTTLTREDESVDLGATPLPDPR